MNIKKIISLFLVTCFFVSFIFKDIYAVYTPATLQLSYDSRMNDKFVLPVSLGKITKSHFAATDRVIINIQDLHCHPKVQKNISNIIDLFNKKFNISNIYLEGAYGNIDVSWLIKIKHL